MEKMDKLDDLIKKILKQNRIKYNEIKNENKKSAVIKDNNGKIFRMGRKFNYIKNIKS